jgi:hypothetical protein
MILDELDSRTLSGTDIESPHYSDGPFVGECHTIYPSRQQVRVIVGEFGSIVRMSAPSLDIYSEGSNRDEAWSKFLQEIRRRDDAAWLMFDVGPTRFEEITEGLDAPEDEDWSEPAEDTEG